MSKIQRIFKYLRAIEIQYYRDHVQCIQISAHTPGIGLVTYNWFNMCIIKGF